MGYIKVISRKKIPKATNSRVSDCYLTPTQQFSAISWRVNFQWYDVRFVLDQDA
jgi:hypothetical protein